jgi:hypothetical protein
MKCAIAKDVTEQQPSLMNQPIPDFDPKLVMSQAERIVQADSAMYWDVAVQTVLSVCCTFPTLCSTFQQANLFSEAHINKWLEKYFKGYNNRPSKRISKKSGTIPDEIVDTIIFVRIPSLDDSKISAIKSAHRLSMAAENILGLLLEEYLAEKLLPYGWYCCWGETMKGVDFCTQNGDLLQVKNRSNSENSSSKNSRQGTSIIKWHRISARDGACYWHVLNQRVGCTELSEPDFSSFVRNTISDNPAAVYVEDDNV